MLLLLFGTPVEVIGVTIETTLPAIRSALSIDSGLPFVPSGGVASHLRERRPAGIRIVTVLPAVSSRLWIQVHDDDLEVLALIDFMDEQEMV
jgi:hypothetical protein